MTIINAFHKDYVKTYLPEITHFLKMEAAYKKASESMTKFVDKKKKTVPTHGTIVGLSKNTPIAQFPQKLTTRQRVLLAPKDFHVFSKAGMPKVKK